MKTRIAFVINSLSGGGAERTVANLSRKLSDRYDTDIIVNDDGPQPYPYQGNMISLRMPVTKNRMNTGYQLKALFRRTRLLRKLKRQRHYMAVLSFSEMTNLANVLTGGKAIISVRNSIGNSITESWKHRLMADYLFPYMFRKACQTVCCSEEIADELVKNYSLPEEKCTVIYNGIDLDEIRKNTLSRQMETVCSQEEHLIVTAGRLTRQKGHWHLIRAVKKLHEDGLKVKLMILGEGDLRKQLEQQIAEYGLEREVLLPGFVDHPEQLMANADVVVFPSLYEGFSNAILEALACGVPVISTDHETGAREILAPDTDYHNKIHNTIEKSQYGILIPVCDGECYPADMPLTIAEQLMAEAIRRILTDQELANHYRQAALLRATQMNLQSVCLQWSNLIEGESV